jgi:hypothetical protein
MINEKLMGLLRLSTNHQRKTDIKIRFVLTVNIYPLFKIEKENMQALDIFSNYFAF